MSYDVIGGKADGAKVVSSGHPTVTIELRREKYMALTFGDKKNPITIYVLCGMPLEDAMKLWRERNP